MTSAMLGTPCAALASTLTRFFSAPSSPCRSSLAWLILRLSFSCFLVLRCWRYRSCLFILLPMWVKLPAALSVRGACGPGMLGYQISAG